MHVRGWVSPYKTKCLVPTLPGVYNQFKIENDMPKGVRVAHFFFSLKTKMI